MSHSFFSADRVDLTGDADACKFSIHGVRRSLITPCRVGPLRKMLAYILGLAAITFSSLAFGGGVIPTQYTLYRSASEPVTPQHTAPNWNTGGNAYTSLTTYMPFDQWKAAGAVIQSASVKVAWKPNSSGSNTGVGFFMCPAQSGAVSGLVGCRYVAYLAASDDQGPASYTPGCVTNIGGPFPCGLDVTATMQSYLAEGLSGQYLVLVSYGNGSTGPLIWDGEMWITWQIP